ncbi:MAG TPA: hypothetical protein VFA78_01330 [Chloroflexota bacterium]|nr:hypothetical protein [Chloroflexota bacterium]
MNDQPPEDSASTHNPIDDSDQPAGVRVPSRRGDSCYSEIVRSSTHGYGTADVSESGIDRSQLRHNLRLTPTERVEQMVAFVRFVAPLQGALRRKRE